MNTDHIREFLEFCKYTNIAKAASSLDITQTVLSFHIATLERELGFSLINRNNPNQLTPSGELFFSEVNPIAEHLEKIIARCQAQENSKSLLDTVLIKKPLLSMGEANSTFRTCMMHFKQCYPDIELRFAPESSASFIEDLFNEKLDCVVTYAYNGDVSILKKHHPEISVQKLASLEFVHILEMPLTLTISKTSPLAKLDKLTAKDVDGYVLPYDLVSSSEEMLFSFETHCKRYNLNLKFVPRMLNFSGLTVMELADNEVMVSSMNFPIPSSLTTREFKGDFKQSIYVAVRASEGNAAAKLFADYLRKNAKSL